MARPNKQGLDYFPFDVDFFDDEKIEAISGEFGIKGEITAIKLLCAIYRNGYFISWNEMLKMKLLKNLPGVSFELLDNIVNRLVKWDFFDKNLFDSTKVLTSRGIQNRFFSISRRRNKSEDYPYLIINVNNNQVNVDNNAAQDGLVYTESTQRKGKKIKEEYNNPLLVSPSGENTRSKKKDLPKILKEEKEKSSAKKGKEYDLSFAPSDDWQTLIREWLEYKADRKESYKSEKAIKAFATQLWNISQKNLTTAQAILQQSYACNYAGIFPLKNSNYANTTNSCNRKMPNLHQSDFD